MVAVHPTLLPQALVLCPKRCTFTAMQMTRALSRSQVTPEAHRELDNARERGAKPPPGDAAAGGVPMAAVAGKGEDPRNLPPVVLMDED